MIDQQPNNLRVQRCAPMVGGLALVAMAVLGIVAHGAANDDLLAGSGDGAAVTPFIQPSVPGMTMGATATESAAATLVTPSAHPAIKAGP